MAWIESVGKRTQKAKHYQDDVTGQWRAEIGIADFHYHDGAAWQDIDESIVDDATDGYAKSCGKTRHLLRIGIGGTRRWYPRRNVATEYVDVTDIEYWRTQGGGSWRAINLPAAVWKSNGADWDLANLHASITNTWRQVKADFILKDATAPTRLRFAMTLVGLTLGADWRLTSTTDSEIVGRIAPPTAVDANEVAVPVTATYAGGYIEWSADATGAVYPVTIDPTYDSQPDATAGLDTMVRRWDAFYSDTNYGTSTTLTYQAIYNTSDAGAYKVLLKFDLSSLSGYSSIDDAKLYLTIASGTWNASAGTARSHRILAANSAWTETGATWNHAVTSTTRWAGDTGSDGGADAGCSVSGTDYAAASLGTAAAPGTDQTTGYQFYLDMVEAEVATMIDNNYGLITGHDSFPSFTVASSDHATTAYRPQLVIVYTVAASGNPLLMHMQQHAYRRGTL